MLLLTTKGEIVFQFQNSAIESQGLCWSNPVFRRFQFQNSAIERRKYEAHHDEDLVFNSKIVRLRDSMEMAAVRMEEIFNSKIVRLREVNATNIFID